MAHAYVGTSGFSYGHWGKTFYPDDLPQKDRLSYYARHFNSIEMNSTFYSLPDHSTVESWREQVPDDFRFVLKASRYITQQKHLKEPRRPPMSKLFTRARRLEEKGIGFLWQLPRWRADEEDVERLEGFLDDLSALTENEWRHAIEFRDETWFKDEVFGLLRDHNVAVVHADMPYQVLPPNVGKRDIPRPEVHAPLTADFVYMRRHGPEGDFGGEYGAGMVETDAKHAKKWLDGGRDVWVFYNNDPKGYAVKDGERMARKLDAWREIEAE